MGVADWNRRRRERGYVREQQKHATFLLKQEQARERARLGHYQDGYNARLAGQPCKPPGYPAINDYDPDEEPYYAMRATAWTEGWEAAEARSGQADRPNL